MVKINALAQEIRAVNKEEKKVLTLVLALPEVQEKVKLIRQLGNGKSQLSLNVSALPDIYIPYYQVNVINPAPSYKILYQFAVDPKTYQIYYYDPIKNHQYTLADWRKMRK
ncbi:hypothetical protein [Pedobacter mendelii]|uniref:Uncharacterized protein n=2 Tax=Pedobacter mendelii TaxID=1908240 RepID=A0ABQ2BKW9_9SPHI|nr:hypothetical protein [Pedobacter mendelii]GGI28619.1 hypothetical protein GCM10008119_33550 [Pedobacter mendelii]